MAKVEMKGIPEIERKISATFKKVRESKQMRKEIGEFVQERIKFEARRARPLNDTRRFPSIKDSTKKIRDFLAKLNSTHPTFKFNRSNLTFSGQLIDAVKFKLDGRAAVSIDVQGTTRRKLKGPDHLTGEVKTNAEVDRELRRRGFVLFTPKGVRSEDRVIKRINSIAKKFVRRAIKVNFET